MASWDRKMHTELARRENAAGKHQADSATIEATKTLESLKNILAHTLGVDDTVNWDLLKDHSAPATIEATNRRSLEFGRKAQILAEAQEHERELADWLPMTNSLMPSL